ncbi:MAG: flavin reductase [Alphaproteobacteria bacterium]|nr:flavin reductase [Alphaproteobacteria bacterium]
MTDMQEPFDSRAFRNALGGFATGVTVVTACDPAGERVGLTVSSFNSVSLDPPLILWSLSKAARSMPAFRAASHYAVNVLAADQVELSQQFARPTEDKFAGVACHEGIGGAPLLDGCVSWFECRNAMTYEGGDHLIFVGEVERFGCEDRPALLFHAGQYGLATRHPETPAVAKPTVPSEGEKRPFVDDYLLYLLARASHQVSARFHARLAELGVSVPEWRVLATLSDSDGMTVSELAKIVLFKQPTLTRILDRMENDGLVERRASQGDRRKVLVHVTTDGGKTVARLKTVAKRHETEVLSDYGPGEAAVLKMVLRTLINRSADG